MMAPAASPPTTPAATPQPLQCAWAEDGNAASKVPAAASAMIICFMGVLSCRLLFGPDHPPKFVTRSLRADKPRLAPANEVAVSVAEWPTGPVTTHASCRIGGAVAFINHITGSRCVVARAAVGDRAADDGAAYNTGSYARTNRAAVAAGVGGGRDAQGAGRHGGDSREREHRLLHGYSLQIRSGKGTDRVR